ncbi:hypothetical protein Tco_0352983 [Tanacetum coccineum]
MNDELMWAADRVVVSTSGFAISIPDTVNEFAIKGNHLTLIKGNKFDGRIKTDPYKHIHEFFEICDMFKYKGTENEAIRLKMFPLSLTARNEQVNAIFTRSGKSYDPPINPNDQSNNSETPINLDSDDEDDEPTPQPKSKDPNPILLFLKWKKTVNIDVIDEILEEDFDALLDEGSKILYSIEGTFLKEKLFAEFDEFRAMTADENSESESETEEPPFKKITFKINYKIITSLEEPPMDLELKPLPDNLEYVFLEEPAFLPVTISSHLSEENRNKLVSVLKNHKQAFSWKTTDIPGIFPSFCLRVCIDYRKLNEAAAKDHFPLPFMDQMVERLVGNKYFCFLDGSSGYFQIPIDPMDQEKTTFTCMLAIFHNMIEESVKVFMDDFSIFGNSFDHCLNNLDKMLQCCNDANLVLNWEKYHFMVKEGIVLGHKVSGAGLEVDKAKIDVISKLPSPTNVKSI